MTLPMDSTQKLIEKLVERRMQVTGESQAVATANVMAALRANDSALFKRWLYVGIENLGEPALTELLLDWLDPFLTVAEQDRLLGWHLG